MTCEPCPSQSRPSRLSQALAIAAKVLMSHLGATLGAPVLFTLPPVRFRSGEVLTEPGMLTVIATSMFLVFSSSMVNAAKPPNLEAQDRKSFKTIPFDPAPSEMQRRELDRMVELCVKTVESEVPGGHFTADVKGGIVNTAGIDRERFRFWKCMLENGHPLAPINK